MEKEKMKCGDCKFLKYIDGEGYGFCSLLEESDVQVIDEACVEFEKDDEDVE